MIKSLMLICLLSLNAMAAEKVSIENNQLMVDGVAAPQLFGAEIQYFRLRGGEGANIPRARVLEIWNRALDHAVDAGMNTISFYIPWDFHEYKEGHFDFNGTVDEDGDGMADYPSRDVLTFIKMIEERGIRRIMARPGPYINAEWGFLGFGAIPLWFHQKYPDSHMQNSDGLRTKLYDYHSPDLHRHTRIWFKTLYTHVLKQHIGGNGSVLFLQLDNETNFMWQSIYNHDYGPRAKARYREFLRANYLFVNNLNESHGTNWASWNEVNPPVIPGLNVQEDRAWYQFQDHSIYTYLKKLRTMWEEIGVHEPEVIFILAESYNAMKNGLLPNFHQRNARGETGMMTMNMYPKTYDLPSSPLMNLPFKADHDVKAMDAASDAYLGKKQEWLMGPEIQGGWWRSTPVASESRLQTYLSTLGHGLKALYIYYFSEGDNWQAGWAKEQIEPLFEELRHTPEYASYSANALPHSFWKQLQTDVDRKVIVGMDVYRIMNDEEASSPTLYFDAPLDHEARPKKHYAQVRDFGRKVIMPHQDFLSRAVRITDPIVILKDSSDHAPSPIKGLDSVLMNSDWCGGLLGYLAQVGISAEIHHWDINDKQNLSKARMIFHQDSGVTNEKKVKFFKTYIENGGTVVSFLGNELAEKLKFSHTAQPINAERAIKIHSKSGMEFDAAPAPLHAYSLQNGCDPILWSGENILGFKCSLGKGTFVQIGALFYDIFNSDWYGKINDSLPRIAFLRSILNSAQVNPLIEIIGADQVSAFARRGTKTDPLWITVKNGKNMSVNFKLKISNSLLNGKKRFKLSGLMSEKVMDLSLSTDKTLYLPVTLKAYGSEAYLLESVDE